MGALVWFLATGIFIGTQTKWAATNRHISPPTKPAEHSLIQNYRMQTAGNRPPKPSASWNQSGRLSRKTIPGGNGGIWILSTCLFVRACCRNGRRSKKRAPNTPKSRTILCHRCRWSVTNFGRCWLWRLLQVTSRWSLALGDAALFLAKLGSPSQHAQTQTFNSPVCPCLP